MNKRIAAMLLLALGISSSAAFAQDEEIDDTTITGETVESVEDVEAFEEEFTESLEPEVVLESTTVIDLETLINLPSGARLRREADEDLRNPRSLFENDQARDEFLGKAPRFVYIPRGVDPMIIPWIRERIVVGELLDDVQEEFDTVRAEPTKDVAVASARTLLRKTESIAAEYPTSNRIAEIQKISDEIRTHINMLTEVAVANTSDQQVTEIAPPSREVILPIWVRENTRGIISDREDDNGSLVLVGDFIIGKGETVELYPGVRVKEIQDRRVIYTYQQTEHVVMVESN
ncbi:MAG: hypothetical protein ACFCU1_05430 [Sumerlaeia bacterium]